MASIWERVGTALKAGAKGAADSILSPSQAQAQAQPVETTPSGVDTPTPASSWTKWVLPVAAAALVGWAVLKPSNSRRR